MNRNRVNIYKVTMKKKTSYHTFHIKSWHNKKRKHRTNAHENNFKKRKRYFQELPAAPSFSASFSIILKFSALFSPRPPVTTTRALPRSGRSVSWDVCCTYLDLTTESTIQLWKIWGKLSQPNKTIMKELPTKTIKYYLQ